MALRGTSSCPRLSFKREELRHDGWLFGIKYTARAVGQKQALGSITIRVDGSEVSHITVDPAWQRCGIGTRLYEKAAKVVCNELKRPLVPEALGHC